MHLKLVARQLTSIQTVGPADPFIHCRAIASRRALENYALQTIGERNDQGAGVQWPMQKFAPQRALGDAVDGVFEVSVTC